MRGAPEARGPWHVPLLPYRLTRHCVWHVPGVNISERKSGTERTKKRNKREYLSTVRGHNWYCSTSFRRYTDFARPTITREIFIPVSRIEFTLKSSVYWPIIGLGTRTWSGAMRCRDPTGQSEFFVLVLHLKTINWMYCYREFIVGIVVSAIAVFRLVDTISV